MQRPGLAQGDVRQVDRGLRRGGQLDLRLLRGLLEALAGDLVLTEVDAVLVLELLDHPLDDPGVPVVATQAVVALGGLDLEHAVGDVQQRDVEGATTEVEDQHGLLLVGLVQAVRQSGRGRLVDDPVDGQTGDLTGLLGRLALGVGEVGGDGDHRVGDGLTEVRLGVALQLLQHERGDLLRLVGLVVDPGRPGGAHVALHRADRTVDVGHRLTLGDLADQDLAALGEGDDGRGRTGTLGVRDDRRLAALEDSDDRVGGAEVDTYCTSHVMYLHGVLT
ncbi:hypothetical protein SDC9_85203 [bioreactor metagenome]|uniref:NAD-specific glutamate dehydrogenase n=1 Tax=bioreactor metagenome TaxID=1076179 RepID=A0A644ZLE3_9ZZZZ